MLPFAPAPGRQGLEFGIDTWHLSLKNAEQARFFWDLVWILELTLDTEVKKMRRRRDFLLEFGNTVKSEMHFYEEIWSNSQVINADNLFIDGEVREEQNGIAITWLLKLISLSTTITSSKHSKYNVNS